MHELHPDDEATLRRVLQRSDIPDDLRDEYLLCRRMYHSIGSTGPLRLMWLIEICRRLGYAPNAPQKIVPARVNWRRLPQDGSVEVAVREEQEGDEFWVKGTFHGFVTGGSLSIKVAGRIREVMLKNVRLYDGTNAVDEMSTPVEPNVETGGEAKDEDVKAPPYIEREHEAVIVAFDDDLVDGTLVGATDDDKAVVLIAGEKKARVFEWSEVTAKDSSPV